ncbi:MAG: RNA polymerase sigma factor [Bacteroidetes bacterium]|nr:RNA polymerase sigma factor [Bacteroidota bacterium]
MIAEPGIIDLSPPRDAMDPSSSFVEDSLLDRAAAGDIMAFRTLYDQWKVPMYTLAFRFHGNREDAEDSLQEAFVHMYRSIGGFRRESRFSSWLYRIVMNACISSTRPRRTGERRIDFSDEAQQPAAEDPPRDVVLQHILEEEIARLPELQRAVFLLYAGEGQTHGDIADILRISVGTSKSCYHRARTALQGALAQRGIQSLEVRQ